MNFQQYQTGAAQTATYPREVALLYVALGLCGEAGEVAEKVKKIYRDDNGVVTDERRAAIKKELGDVAWYLAQVCTELDLQLDDVARSNLAKLADRVKRDVLHGNGDNR